MMIAPFYEKAGIVNRELLIDTIRNKTVIPHFQPIVNLTTGNIFAYEVLSRFPDFPGATIGVFEKAREWGLSWDLEVVCRQVFLEKMHDLKIEDNTIKFFLNVSPHIFSDPRFLNQSALAGFESLSGHGNRLVVEITETTTVENYDVFEKIIHHYTGEGIHIALDDFGAGHSGLLTLVATTPHFLKLDRGLIKDIHINSYRQNLVKFIVEFSANVETNLIGEGVETEAEMKSISRLGVRYGQGYFFAKPSPELCPLGEEAKAALETLFSRRKRNKYSQGISISKMAVRPESYKAGEICCSQLEARFKKDPKLDHVVVLNGEALIGIITRRYFYQIIGGQFGFALFQHKGLEQVAKTSMLCINEQLELRTVGRLAMMRDQNDLYDPVIVVDDEKRLIGTITMKQVITHAFDLEIKIAMSANPLTQLPGNIVIGYWLEEAMHKGTYAIAYIDLDHFKEYNDTYGFTKGDELLKLTAKILSQSLRELPVDTKLGHIGGDDFILVSEEMILPETLGNICNAFDLEKKDFFTIQDIERNHYIAPDRKGIESEIPLVTMSISVISSNSFKGVPHPGMLGQAAAHLKKEVKRQNKENLCSGFICERRVYDC